MIKKLTLLVNFVMFVLGGMLAQSNAPKSYFDKSGKTSTENMAYYYRQETDTAGYYRSYYVSNDRLYFKGKLKLADADDDNKSLFSGECFWYHKNGNLKQFRAFNEKNLEVGTSKYYYESGKLWKEIEYENGKIKDNTYSEYNEDGTKSRIFDEEFLNNYNDWDIYLSDKSIASINDGIFELVSLSPEGSARYINHPVESEDYTIEAQISVADLKDKDKIGIIYGFKDWQNYHYFVMSKKAIYIGTFYEGFKSIEVEGMFCKSIDPKKFNNIKILSNGEHDYFSINGEVQYKDKFNKLYGNNFGFIVSGKSKAKIEKLSIKEINASGVNSSKNTEKPVETDKDVKVTGSGIIFSSNGLILTNHHVISTFNKFTVDVNGPNGKVSYNAELVKEDRENDIAILKIKDENFTPLNSINYSFKESGSQEVGSSVFTIGYPYALSGMGKEAKFSDGKVSAKTGYNGSINSFQTTIPVQPGNSGGPVFNETGQFVGLINAKFADADNASYVIKLNYIKNLIELLNDPITLPNNGASLSDSSLEEKIKELTKYVVLVKVK